MVRRILKSQLGVSIVQVILSLGLLSGILVAAIKIASNQTKLGKSSSFYFESLDVLDQIKSNFHEPKSCLLSLKSKSATYSKVDTILRFNPQKKDGDIIFEKGQKSLGQSNVSILEIELIGDRPGFAETNGFTTLRVKFLGKNREEFSAEFPLRVQLDTFDRIIGCQSSPGIYQGSSGVISSDIWLPTKQEISQKDGIYSLVRPYKIGRVPAKGALNIHGGLLIGDERSVCSQDKVGTLRFSKKDQKLYLCSDEGVWKSLNRSEKALKEKKSYVVKAGSAKINTFQTPKTFKLCRVSSFKYQAGQCWARPVSAGKIETKWDLVSQFFRGDQLKCNFDCYR
jgi:hypothetical protein